MLEREHKPAGDPARRVWSGDQMQHLNEQVYGVLKRHIVDAVFGAGLVIRENSIVEAFGVGRAPAAMALRKLEDEGLVVKHRGRGFVVVREGRDVTPHEMSLDEAGLVLPASLADTLKVGAWKEHIYPEVEKTVASLLVFGRFRINQSILADHYGVSRTIAREILTHMESRSLVRRGPNSRWYAGPLTFEQVKESYELRWLLEPEALRQAALILEKSEILAKRDRVDAVLSHGLGHPDDLNDIEADLHNDIVLQCANQQMKRVLAQCQMPIIATFGTVVRDRDGLNFSSGIPEAMGDHRRVFDLLLVNRNDAAAEALHEHIRNAFRLCSPHFEILPPLPVERIPDYMVFEATA